MTWHYYDYLQFISIRFFILNLTLFIHLRLDLSYLRLILFEKVHALFVQFCCGRHSVELILYGHRNILFIDQIIALNF